MIELPTHAITLHQPWGSLIMLTDESKRKGLENRTWAPAPSQLKIGGRVWIHAGMKIDGAAMLDYEEDIDFANADDIPRGMMLGHVRFDGVVRESDSRWFNPARPGERPTIGWLLSDPVPLRTLVPCLGAQRLWKVNDAMLAKLAHAA
jgi:hypothetical protein